MSQTKKGTPDKSGRSMIDDVVRGCFYSYAGLSRDVNRNFDCFGFHFHQDRNLMSFLKIRILSDISKFINTLPKLTTLVSGYCQSRDRVSATLPSPMPPLLQTALRPNGQKSLKCRRPQHRRLSFGVNYFAIIWGTNNTIKGEISYFSPDLA